MAGLDMMEGGSYDVHGSIEMRALRFHSFGALSSVLRIEDIRTPMTGDGDLLVQVKAAAINPSDVKNVQGIFSQTTLPRTPGRDFSAIGPV